MELRITQNMLLDVCLNLDDRIESTIAAMLLKQWRLMWFVILIRMTLTINRLLARQRGSVRVIAVIGACPKERCLQMRRRH